MSTTGLPLPGNLPSSNAGGNNQTSPGLSNIQGTVQPFTPVLPTGSAASSNPYLTATPTTPTANPTGSLYNTATSSGYGGQSNIGKQLTDIYGKGVGGSFNYLLQGMSGTDSAIFQQYVNSMQPQMAKAQAQLNTGLGSQGVGANSSVNALAQADLQSQFLAQESGVNANLMQTQLQDTQNILEGAAGAAQQQVAQSGWNDFASVMSNVTQDAGALFGGSMPGLSSISHLFGGGGGGSLPIGGTSQMNTDFMNAFQAATPSSGGSSFSLPMGGMQF